MIETKTVDITHVKKVLNSCPYYDYIVNYDFNYQDEIVLKLIDWYKELVFSCDGNNLEELHEIEEIDKALYLLVTNGKFRRGLRFLLTPNDISFDDEYKTYKLIKLINDYTSRYEKESILSFKASKWI